MNLMDLLNLPLADAALPALPVLPVAPALPMMPPVPAGVATLPVAAPLPAFAETLDRLQPTLALPDAPAIPAATARPDTEEPVAAETAPALLPGAELLSLMQAAAWVAMPTMLPTRSAEQPVAAPAVEGVELPGMDAGVPGLTQLSQLPQLSELPPAPQPVLGTVSMSKATQAAESTTPAVAAPVTEKEEPRRQLAELAELAPERFEAWMAAQGSDDAAGPAGALETRLRLSEPAPSAPEPGRAWRQPLLQALGDRLQLQIAARSEQAVIRLEPPLLGRIEIAIRHEGGELQVRMAASHGEVGRQLQQLAEPLRQDLLQRHSGEVSVQVSSTAEAARGGQAESQAGGRGSQTQQQQQQQERRPGRGLAEEGESAAYAADSR